MQTLHRCSIVLVALFCVLSSAHAAALPTQSSSIAITSDDKILACVNPDNATVSVFDVSTGSLTKTGEIKVGHEPVSICIHPDNKSAFVANALDGTVMALDLVKRRKTASLTVGKEPQAVALSPNGARLYVANSASNNLMVFDTTGKRPALMTTIDLSPFGTAPRAIAVTNNGGSDLASEVVFVALFYAQLGAGKTAFEEGQDDQREGRVVAIDAATNTILTAPNPILLAPMASTGFNSNGKLAPAVGTTPAIASTNPQSFTTPTGAFPNQLAAIALHPTNSLGYVVSTGASPNGPLRFNQMAQGLVSVFNATTRTEVAAAQTDPSVRRTSPLNLNQGINLGTTPAPRLFLTNPVAMAWRPDGSDAWVVIQNTDLLVRLTVDGSGIPTVGNPLVAGPSTLVRVDLQNAPNAADAGKAPRGVTINNAGTRAFVFNFVTRNVSAVDISNPAAPAIVNVASSSAAPKVKAGSVEESALAGAEFFYSGRGPQGRLSSEGWGACIVCHPGGRSDNITWMFDTGPRQTISLDGMFDPKKKSKSLQRILNWSAVRDETQDFELNTRNVFGGRGLIDDDRLFLAVGGTHAGTDSALLEQFNQATGAPSATNDLKNGDALPTLATSRRDFAIATLDDDRVFIIGGRTGPAPGALVSGADAVLEFNPRTNAFAPRGKAGFTARHSLGAAAVQTSTGPRIYAIGGYASTDPASAPVGNVEEFDPVADKWRTVASLPTPVSQFGITVTGGINTAEPLQLIHVVSGNTGTEVAPSVANANPVQRYQADPAGPGTWSAFTLAITLRRNLGAATALRGVQSRVFVIGGQDAAGTVLDTVEEYLGQGVTIVSSPHTSIVNSLLSSPRARFGIASSLSTNQIYVIGGMDQLGADQSTILEYTINNNGTVAGPAGTPSGSWVSRGNLSVARNGLQVSSPPGVVNLLPVKSTGRSANADALAAFVASRIRPAKAPVTSKDAAAKRGQKLFGTAGLVLADISCATCHGGPKWTRSSVDFAPPPSPEIGLGFGNERVIGAELRQTKTQMSVLNDVGTFTAAAGRQNEIRFNGADISQAIAPLGANGFNIPSLLSLHETAPYFYNGLAQTLDQVLDGSQDNNGGSRVHFISDAAKRADLIQFLKSIDEKTKTFK